MVLLRGSPRGRGPDRSLWGCPRVPLRGCPYCWGARSPREGDLGCVRGVPGGGGSLCWSLPERTQPGEVSRARLLRGVVRGHRPIRGEATGVGY